MIELYALFWILIIMFAIIGGIRGWSKEVIATAGLILSLFTINLFGWTLARLFGGSVITEGDLLAQMRRQFLVLGSIHALIAFFSYQGVALVKERLTGRERFQERILGFIFGAINGFLMLGTVWTLLEFTITSEGWVRLPPDFPYAFDPVLIRPLIVSPGLEMLLTHLPIPWLAPWLPVFLILIFLFVIVAVI